MNKTNLIIIVEDFKIKIQFENGELITNDVIDTLNKIDRCSTKQFIWINNYMICEFDKSEEDQFNLLLQKSRYYIDMYNSSR